MVGDIGANGDIGVNEVGRVEEMALSFNAQFEEIPIEQGHEERSVRRQRPGLTKIFFQMSRKVISPGPEVLEERRGPQAVR